MKAKYFLSGLFLAAGAMLFTACDSDRDDNPVLDTSTVSGVQFKLNTPAYAAQLIDLENSSSVNFTWSQPEYGFTVPVTYSLQISLDGSFTTDVSTIEEGASTAGCYYNLMGSTNAVSLAAGAADFNRGVVTLAGWETEDQVPATQSVYVRCKATLTDEAVPAVYSNTVTVTVVPSFNVAPSYAEFIYMMGNFNSWSTPAYMRSVMDSNDLPTNIYRRFNWLDGGFKFRPNVDSWDDDFGQDPDADTGALIVDGEVDCQADAAFYLVEVDIDAMTYSLTEIKNVSIIGGFNDWSGDVEMTYNTDGGYWEVTTDAVSGEYKFRANHDWAINWGGTESALTQDGANLSSNGGTHTYKLYLSYDGDSHVVIE